MSRAHSPAVTRWWARIGLVVGFAASVTANVLSAPETLEGRAITVMYPIMLAIGLEVAFRVTWSWRPIDLAKAFGILSVASAAAVGSASHIYEVAMENGQPPLVAAFLVVAVDGLMLVCTLVLVDMPSDRKRPKAKPVRASEPVEKPEAPKPKPAPAPKPEPLRAVPEPEPEEVLDPAAEARRLHALGLKQTEIAAQIGKSDRQVRRYLKDDAA